MPAENPTTASRTAASRSRHRGRAPRSSSHVPAQQPAATTDAAASGAEQRRDDPSATHAVSGTRREHDKEPDDDHRDDRRGVDQVLDRQRRHRLTRGQVMPGEEDLGGLAGQQAERRHVADGVAGEKRLKRLTERQA